MTKSALNSRLQPNLGVDDFDDPAEVARMQSDIVKRLARSNIKPYHYRGLGSCGEDRCGFDQCIEACWWQRRRERRELIPRLHEILSKARGPICEVRLIQGSWARPYGRLHEVRIDAAKQMNSRLLNRFFDLGIKSIGSFKVRPDPYAPNGPLWRCELHEIVVGVAKDELEQRFTSGRRKSRPVAADHNPLDLCRVTSVQNLGQSISDVLRQTLQEWWYPEPPDANGRWMRKAQRTELYNWLLSLVPGGLLVRYGLDRHFNVIQKKPRLYKLKPNAPRRAGAHLDAFKFGEGEAWEHRPAPWEVGFPSKPLGTVRYIPDEEYYKELRDDYVEPRRKRRK